MSSTLQLYEEEYVISFFSSYIVWMGEKHQQTERESWKEKFKPWLLSHLCTAGQSLREVGVNVRSLVSESYRNGQTQAPLIPHRISAEGGGFRSYLTVQHAVLMEHTDHLTLAKWSTKFQSDQLTNTHCNTFKKLQQTLMRKITLSTVCFSSIDLRLYRAVDNKRFHWY